MFGRDNEMRDIVLTDADSRDRLIRFFFNRALHEVTAKLLPPSKLKGQKQALQGPVNEFR